jgi:hypothetical protein
MKSLSKIRRSLLNDRPISILDKAFGRWVRPGLYRVSPLWLSKYRYNLLKGQKLDLMNPQTFDQKLLWLNHYWRHPLKSQCADKYGVRSYVAERGYGHILPKLLGIYGKSYKIDFDALPDRFVLKCTHGCNFNIICDDKNNFDMGLARAKLDHWLKLDISKRWAEIHYKKIRPRIICEEFLDDGTGFLPVDYKIFCFGGAPHCTMACSERDPRDARAKYDFYNLEWTAKLAYSKTSLLADRKIPKPEGYDDMLAAAKQLSAPFPFVRVDLYSIRGRVVFGEMTFTPDGCIDVNFTDLAQRVLGELVKLPEPLL